MIVFTLLKRNMKWRFHNAFTILITILQPVLWLTLYSAMAARTMKQAGIENYTAFLLPGVLVLVCFSVCSSSGMMNYMMRADGSFYRILTAPVRRSSIVLGQILEAVICTYLEAGIMGLLGLLYSVRIAAGAAGFFLMCILIFFTAFFMAGLSFGISLILPDEALYETVMNAIVLPVFFLSSALFPAEDMDGALGVMVRCNPFTHMIDVMRSLILQGKVEGRRLFFVLLLFGILGSIGFGWAVWRIGKETDL